MRSTAPRPEHRDLDPHADGIVDLGRSSYHDSPTKLNCTACRPYRTRPVRKQDDPDSVVRCAQCGKKHGTDSLEVVTRNSSHG